MSPAVVLAIVVATHNVDDAAIEALRATAAEALGSEDAIVVREVEVPSDGEALRIERSVRAQTVAQVVWLDAEHTRARLRVHAVETGRWIERTITFSSVDTPVERGRALGFAVTSMLPEEVLAANPHRRPDRPQQVSKIAEGDFGTSLRLGLAGSLGLGGTATGLGGAVAGEFYLTSSWLLRLSFAGRWGPIPALSIPAQPDNPMTPVNEKIGAQQASDLAGYAGLGVGFWPMRRAPGRPLTVGVRVDALVLYHGVRGPSLESTLIRYIRKNKFLPGLDVFGEASWALGDAVEIVASLGVEAAFGSTTLQLRKRQGEPPLDTLVVRDVGKIPIFRSVGEVGLRVSF